MARPAAPIVSLLSLLAPTAFSQSIPQIPKSKSEPILSHPYDIIFRMTAIISMLLIWTTTAYWFSMEIEPSKKILPNRAFPMLAE